MNRCLSFGGAVVVGCGLFSSFVFAEPQTSTHSPLEGTKWTVRVVPDQIAAQQGEKAFDDTLMFQDDKVAMSACLKAGFAASTYTASQSGEQWAFKTAQVSPTAGNTNWDATIQGTAITGTMVMTKKDGTVSHYTFSGKKT